MSQTVIQLGFVPKERGEYNSSEKYYKDNIVQYEGSSYVADPVGYDPEHPASAYNQGVAPWTADPQTLNAGWKVFASGNNKFATGESVDQIGIDPRPKKGSQNFVTSGGVFDNMGALDVSELNATENPHTLASYVDLSAALAAIPSDYQKGGMSIKFIQSSDNKYVQYRYMGTAVTGSPNPFLDTANWQGVDDEPTAGSDNMTKSGGIVLDSENVKQFTLGLNSIQLYEGSLGTDKTYSTSGKFAVIPVNGGDVIYLKAGSQTGYTVVKSYSGMYMNPLNFATGYTGRVSLVTDIILTVPSDGRYIIINMLSNDGTTDMRPITFTINGVDITKSIFHVINVHEELAMDGALLNVSGIEGIRARVGGLGSDKIYNTNGIYKVIPVKPSDSIVISSVNQSDNVQYAVVKSYNGYSNIDNATGYNGRVSFKNTTHSFIVPSDGRYVILQISNDSISRIPTDFTINGKSIFTQSIVFKGTNKQPSDIGFDTNPLPFSANIIDSNNLAFSDNALKQYVYGLKGAINLDATLGSDKTYAADGKIAIISVKSGDTIIISAKEGSRTYYACVKSYESLYVNPLDFATGFSERVRVDTSAAFTIPSDGKYLIVTTVANDGVGDWSPDSLIINGINIVKSVDERGGNASSEELEELKLQVNNNSTAIEGLDETVRNLQDVNYQVEVDTNSVKDWLNAHSLGQNKDDLMAWYYNSYFRRSTQPMYNYINTIISSKIIQDNKLLLSTTPEIDKKVHDSTICLYKAGEKAYVVTTANQDEAVDSPGYGTHAFTRLITLNTTGGNMSLVSVNDFFKEGNTYGSVVTNPDYGTGVPNIIGDANGVAHIITQAAIGSDEFFSIVCCDLNMATGVISNYRVPNVVLGGNTVSMSAKNLQEYFNTLGDDSIYWPNYNNAYFNPNCNIAYDSVSGYYYICIGLLSHWKKIPIFKTLDFTTFELVCIPDIIVSVDASMESALAIQNGYMYMATRQYFERKPLEPAAAYSQGRSCMVLSKLDMTNFDVLEECIIPDDACRPTFFKLNNKLYLGHSVYKRGYLDIILIDENSLKDSELQQQITELVSYPSFAEYSNGTFIMSGSAGGQVYASKVRFMTKTQSLINSVFESLF